MKIAWFTPFNKKSAIAKVSRLIVEKLAEKHHVDIWVSEDPSEWLDTKVSKIKYDYNESYSVLADYDHIIYNFGNNHIFHGPIFEISRNYPGVAILHDYTLHIFFEEHYKLKGIPHKYVTIVNNYYGEQASKDAQQSVELKMLPTLSRSNEFVRMPLFEPALEGMKGCFIHSRFSQNVVNEKFLLPTDYAYLPYPLEKIRSVDKKVLREKLGLPSEKMVFVSTGIVHPVKRIEQFLLAWGKAKNKDDFYYCVLGEYGQEYHELLLKIAHENNLEKSIVFLGWTSEETLVDYLDACDIAINLRFPNSEGCSYSAVEQLAHGLPVICNDSGFYSELPKEIAFKVRIGHDVDDILKILESIESPSDLQIKANLAKQFSKENFSVSHYCEKLETYLPKIGKSYKASKFENIYINWVAEQLNYLFPRHEESLSLHIDRLLNERQTTLNSTGKKKLGLWFGFPYQVGLRREGITRFAVSFATALIQELGYEIEVWCYDINKEEMEISFSSLFSDPSLKDKVKIVTEANYVEQLGLRKYGDKPTIQESWHISQRDDNLHIVANKYSEAQTFMVAIVYLINASQLNKRLLVAAHDLQPLVDYETFTKNDRNQIYHIRKIHESAQRFVRKDAVFFSNSEFVMKTQIRHFLPNIAESKSHFVYLPGNFPKHETPPEDSVEFKNKFNLKKPYLFLATQFRPYKNIKLLLQAALLNSKITEHYELIFTGNLNDDPDAKNLVETSTLKNCVRMVGPLTEQELRNFYLHSDFIVVPTLFEGGFPWQALEGMYYGRQVLMSRIPITVERLAYENFPETISSFMLFDPNSADDLCSRINYLLENRKTFEEKQRPIAKRLLAYDWQKAIKVYANKLDL